MLAFFHKTCKCVRARKAQGCSFFSVELCKKIAFSERVFAVFARLDAYRRGKARLQQVRKVKANEILKLAYEVHLKTQRNIVERAENSEPKPGTEFPTFLCHLGKATEVQFSFIFKMGSTIIYLAGLSLELEGFQHFALFTVTIFYQFFLVYKMQIEKISTDARSSRNHTKAYYCCPSG